MRAPGSCSQRTSNWGGLPDTRRKTVQIAAAVFAATCSWFSIAPASATVNLPKNDRTSTQIFGIESEPGEWEDMLLWYILWLYETLGGNPDEVTPIAVNAMASLDSYYYKHGMRVGMNEAQRAATRAMVEGLWMELSCPPPNTTAPTLNTYGPTLERMYIDVGGNPDALF